MSACKILLVSLSDLAASPNPACPIKSAPAPSIFNPVFLSRLVIPPLLLKSLIIIVIVSIAEPTAATAAAVASINLSQIPAPA